MFIMKRTKLLLLTMLFGFGTTAMAQIEEDYDDEAEIVVTEGNTDDDNIDFPEAMNVDVDSLLHLYNVQNYLTQDDDCNMQDVNPMYDAETYIDRLSKMPTLIEMPYNEVVQKYIDRYSSNLRRTVSIMLGASNFYMPIFEQALETYGLPLELKYLPVIESALNPTAVSRVGATGLWQFMLATGKQYGLEVNTLVDERRDPIKSSYAAAHYLSDLYRIFGDWSLAIAAYNCGPENINKAIHRANGEKDFWQIYPYLPKETRGYVPAFIAANYIMNYYCEHNICPMVTNLPAKSDTVEVNRDIHFEQIAAHLDISVDQLKELNPQYRHNIVNGKTKPSALRLPATLLADFIEQEESIADYRASELLTKRAVAEVNNAQPVVSSPRKTTTRKKSTKSRKSSSSKKRSSSRNVTVKKGDSLSTIAARNHTTAAKLKKLNGIKGNTIKPGQKLKVK